MRTMKWKVPQRIIGREDGKCNWLCLNVMCPVPTIRENGTVRVYCAFCDEDNKGRVGYVDVDADDPTHIIHISEVPCLDIGERGTFDDSGVLPTCVFEEHGILYMYYCGFQRHINVPYTSLLGIAESRDGGNTFHRIKNTPVLERKQGELFIRTGAYCIFHDDHYELFYASGDEWFDLYKGKMEPVYHLRSVSSKRKDVFTEEKSIGVINLEGDEYGIIIPQYLCDLNRELLIFSVRSKSRGYRIEYAEKKSNIWERKGEIGLERVAHTWCDEMQCFGKMLSLGDRRLLFFCGNHYGMGGMGWTELEN